MGAIPKRHVDGLVSSMVVTCLKRNWMLGEGEKVNKMCVYDNGRESSQGGFRGFPAQGSSTSTELRTNYQQAWKICSRASHMA
jgi:hypothetical protein